MILWMEDRSQLLMQRCCCAGKSAKVQQGCIEGSNVNVVDEMVKMITISRAYQAGQKVINTVDETLDKTVNQVGKV